MRPPEPIPSKRKKGRPPKCPLKDMKRITDEQDPETDEPDPEITRDLDAERFTARRKHIEQPRDMDVYVAEPKCPGQSKPLLLKWMADLLKKWVDQKTLTHLLGKAGVSADVKSDGEVAVSSNGTLATGVKSSNGTLAEAEEKPD